MKQMIIGYRELISSHKFSRRSILKGLALSTLTMLAPIRAYSATRSLNIILGRPTATGGAISVIADSAIKMYIEYGYSKTSFALKTKIVDCAPNVPTIFDLANLKSSSTVYYRIRSKDLTEKTYQVSEVNSFSTQKKINSTFSFVVQGDSHPERAGKMFNSDLYYRTLQNIASQKPDFMIMLGDDFSIDPLIEKGQADQSRIENIYATQRKWLTTSAKSVPLFLVNGNHEQAAAYLLDGTATNPAVLAGNARLKYFPLPDLGTFYSADAEEIPNVGRPRDYYSWTWGDALFITLDPYWHSKNPVDNVAGVSADAAPTNNKTQTNAKGGQKTGDLWAIGIGDAQYAWLKSTLETSKAKFKFVFAHHVMGTGRGGVEVSTQYEWGGKDPKGNKTFAQMRPNWDLPIHDLMVKNGVNIFFQGHDHIFVHQERDGLVYQSMPNPADDTFTMFNEAAYLSGTKAPNSGHVRVTVSPTQAQVEYFLSARPQDESTGRVNMQLAHSYTVKPRA